MPDKAVFVSAVLLCVQRYRGKPTIFTNPKAASSGKEWNLHFHSDQREKPNKWAANMLMFNFDINMKRLGFRFKNDSFQ